MHHKCYHKSIQRANEYNFIIRVNRDKHRNPDFEWEASTDDNVNVKYKKEVHFAFSILLVPYLDGKVVGLCIPRFKYTEQTLLSLVGWANTGEKRDPTRKNKQ